jgi:hypothetical protein
MHSNGRPNPEQLLAAAREGRRKCLGRPAAAILPLLIKTHVFRLARGQSNQQPPQVGPIAQYRKLTAGCAPPEGGKGAQRHILLIRGVLPYGP